LRFWSGFPFPQTAIERLEEIHILFYVSHFFVRRQTSFRRLQRRKPAVFLLDQVILDAADLFSGLEDFEPGRVALS
jgi:hypothetical protein